MWSVNSKGTISWSEEAKLELLKLIKSRPIVLSNEDSDRNKKTQAWQHIYIALTKSGMPNSTVDKVRNTWNRLSSSTKTAVQRSRRLKKSVDFTKVQLLCNEILDNLNGIPPLPRVSSTSLTRHQSITYHVFLFTSYSQSKSSKNDEVLLNSMKWKMTKLKMTKNSIHAV